MIHCNLVMLFAYNLLAKKMALIYRYIGDTPNDFEVYTDGVRVPNATGVMVIPDSFHVTEVRNITFFDVANNMNIIEEEITRRELRDLAEDNGYQMIEFDDTDQLTTLHDPPRITTYNPARGAEIAAITSNIVLTFSENVAKAAATGPVVRLINLTTNVLIETFGFLSPLQIKSCKNEIKVNLLQFYCNFHADSRLRPFILFYFILWSFKNSKHHITAGEKTLID